MKKLTISSIALMTALSCSCVTEAGEKPNTCKIHLQLANDGIAKSQVLVGNCYRTGRLGDINLDESEYWYEKAAESGNPDGMLALASLYIFDMKAEENYSEAVRLLRSAADKGVANASFVLGLLHLNGIEVNKNIEKAKALFEHAANEGHGWSMLTMYTLSSGRQSKEKWKKLYQENYSKLYSWEVGYDKFINDKHIKKFIFDALDRSPSNP